MSDRMSMSDAALLGGLFSSMHKITRPEHLDLHDKYGVFSVIGNYGGVARPSYADRAHELVGSKEGIPLRGLDMPLSNHRQNALYSSGKNPWSGLYSPSSGQYSASAPLYTRLFMSHYEQAVRGPYN